MAAINVVRVCPCRLATSPSPRQKASSSETLVRCPSIVTERLTGGVMGGRSIIALVLIVQAIGARFFGLTRIALAFRLAEPRGIRIALRPPFGPGTVLSGLPQIDDLGHLSEIAAFGGSRKPHSVIIAARPVVGGHRKDG